MEKKYQWSWPLCFKGIAMGIADVIPGVSGGTIALLLGIYETFIKSLSELTPKVLLDVLKGRISPALVFLFNLGIGIIIAIIGGAKLIHFSLEVAPEFVWGIFFILILSSLVILLKKEQKNIGLNAKSYILFLAGAVAAYFVNQLVPHSQDITYLNVFVGGFIAIFAMMLPGVSGSFLLLVLGLYQYILTSLKNPLEIESLKTLSIFALGALSGLLLGSRLLKALLKSYRHETLVLLLGFMLGSAPKLWPWQDSVFIANAYHLGVIFVMAMSLALFFYISKTADLKESKTRNKMNS